MHRRTHREENHWHGQRYSGQDGQAHDQKHNVKIVDPGVRVQELGLDGLWKLKHICRVRLSRFSSSCFEIQQIMCVTFPNLKHTTSPNTLSNIDLFV